MKILIAEDDMTSRLFMKKYLGRYGDCDIAVNGMEAIDLALGAIDAGSYYDLICIDIMMPKVDGIKALKTIREIEAKFEPKGIKKATIIMTTALNDKKTVDEAYKYGCEAYAWKPIEVEQFDQLLENLNLI